MFKRVKLIQGIGNFSKTTAGSIEFASVNILYAENRNGKSTLCDIFRSLSIDEPDLINNRKAIPRSDDKPPKVEFQFQDGEKNHVASFDHGEWEAGLPPDLNLFVFDHSFIHRNVITGQKQERDNSENVTDFILGEGNVELFNKLEGLNTSLRSARKELSTLKEQSQLNNIADVPEYTKSPLPDKTKKVLEKEVNKLKQEEGEVATIIRNSALIKERKVLSPIANKTKFTESTEAINKTLEESIQDIHKDSLKVLNLHIDQHVNHKDQFKAWASQGERLRKDDSCPFCGQSLGESEQELLNAYQKIFNEEFRNYEERIKQTLNNLRQPFSISDTKYQINQLHQSNLSSLALYQESDILNHPLLAGLKGDLEAKLQELLTCYDSLFESINPASQRWKSTLDHKYNSPYEAIKNIDFSELLSVEAEYNQAIFKYWEVAKNINALLSQFKDSLDDPALQQKAATLAQQRASIENQIKRIDLNLLCGKYNKKHSEISRLDKKYKQGKKTLENYESDFLEKYFDLVNSLFRALGSDEFEIIKVANNRGKRIVYDLTIKFKGDEIPPDKVNFVFSESDRRALALCLFLAKILSLRPEEQSESILVLDDPVTSFDNERITLILDKFGEIQPRVKQLLIATHYKGMASKVVKKFHPNIKLIKLTPSASGIEFKEADNNDMIATDHDLCFDRISAFVKKETNGNISTELRPFFEEEVRSRFKKQLSELGYSNSKSNLSACIKALEDKEIISTDLAKKLSNILGSLNNLMHETTQDTVENTRSVAKQVLGVIYEDLTPAACIASNG